MTKQTQCDDELAKWLWKIGLRAAMKDDPDTVWDTDWENRPAACHTIWRATAHAVQRMLRQSELARRERERHGIMARPERGGK